MISQMTQDGSFRIAFSADFVDERKQLIFPDIGLSILDADPAISHPLSPYDVIISLNPRLTAASLAGIEKLCAIGRCGVGYDNVDLGACTDRDRAVYITPGGVVRPMAEFSV